MHGVFIHLNISSHQFFLHRIAPLAGPRRRSIAADGRQISSAAGRSAGPAETTFAADQPSANILECIIFVWISGAAFQPWRFAVDAGRLIAVDDRFIRPMHLVSAFSLLV
jgi:hypothetical protein